MKDNVGQSYMLNSVSNLCISVGQLQLHAFMLSVHCPLHIMLVHFTVCVVLARDEDAVRVIRETEAARLLADVGVDAHKMTFRRRMVYKFHARQVRRS